MAFDLTTATPVAGFDLATAKPAKKVQNYTLPDGSMHTSLGGPLPAGAIPNGQVDPTSGMSTADKFWAGAGKAPVDLGRGIGQLTGLESRADVAESRKLDAPLMSTGAGKVGNLAGNVAQLVPTAFIPGANTLAGAGTIGALAGLLQPSTSTRETAANIGLGGVLGPTGLLAGRGVAGAYGLGRGLLEPFLPQGPQRIAARALQGFAGSPQEAASAAANLTKPTSVLPGVQPTTAELAQNPGLSQLQRTLQNNPQFLTDLTNRMQTNRGAMTSAISGIAGTDADMAAATAARKASTAPLYDAAAQTRVTPDLTLATLLQRPSMREAVANAQRIAQERGQDFMPGGKLSGGDVQALKQSMADMINTGPQRGIGANQLHQVRSTSNAFNDWVTANVPELKAADAEFAAKSVPINQMEVGTQLSNKLIPALNDFGNAGGLNANNFATAVRNGDQLAANATGFHGSTLANTLSPQHLQTIQQVGEQLARTAGTNIGRATGSNTAQNLIGEDFMRRILGPLGLPKTLASSVIAKTLSRPVDFMAKMAEPDITGLLQQAALDPKVAAGLLSQVTNNPALARALWARQGLLSAPTLGLANSPQQ